MKNKESSGLIFPRPFMYGIQSPDDTAYLAEDCVHNDHTVLESVHASALNEVQEGGQAPYRVVALYTAEQVRTMMAAHGIIQAAGGPGATAPVVQSSLVAGLEDVINAPELSPAACSEATFWRQPRYLVLKKSDLYALALDGQFSGEEADLLASLADRLARIRAARGKLPLRCVVVESDWPEYKVTYDAIRKRTEASDE